MIKTNKKWYQSKTKWAALFIAIGPILTTIGSGINGSIDIASVITQLSSEIGIVLAIFGVRDLPFINKK